MRIYVGLYMVASAGGSILYGSIDALPWTSRVLSGAPQNLEFLSSR